MASNSEVRTLDVDGYKVTDSFFGAPYIRVDEERTDPSHRRVEGGFEGTATRFQFYFPPKEVYRGRFIQPMMGGMGGMKDSFGPHAAAGRDLGGYDFGVRLGAYTVEDNQGHKGKEMCPKAGLDATIYGWRASAECARFARHLAQQIYGEAPHHGYVFGGSGGALRSAQCIENVYDVWDGAMPFMGASAAPPRPSAANGGSAMYHGFRVLRHRLADIVDALEPGGSGDPFVTLNSVERQALLDLYRSGFPRGAERRLPHISGNLGLWAWSADQWYAEDPGYYERFWTDEGFAGHDEPHIFAGDLIADTRVTVRKVMTSDDLAALGGGRVSIEGGDLVNGAVIDPIDGFLVGSSVRVITGAAAGRQLYCVGVNGATILVDGAGEAGNLRFAGVAAGDQLELDNRRFLAFTMRYRHSVSNPNAPAQSHLAVDGRPIYPQLPAGAAGFALPPHMGVPLWSGRFKGKVLTVQHAHDSMIWPTESRYEDGQDRWAIRWTQHAEHIPPSWIPIFEPPLPATSIVNYAGTLEQSLHDLVAWVENGVRPTETTYSLRAGEALQLPSTAAERGGIQPVVRATANGRDRADVKVGEAVTLAVEAEVPPGAGTIIGIEWDFDGLGKFPFVQPGVDGAKARIEAATPHAFDRPGVYFPAVKVTSHRDGDVKAVGRRVQNLGRARVVVT